MYWGLQPCISGLIIVQKYGFQNLDVDVINRKLLIYFFLFQAFSYIFLLFCFCWYSEYWRKWNIRKYEPQCEPLTCTIVIIWWVYYHLAVVSVLWIILLCRSVQRYLVWKLIFFSPLNSRNHNLNATIFALFGFKFLSVLSVHVYMVKGWGWRTCRTYHFRVMPKFCTKTEHSLFENDSTSILTVDSIFCDIENFFNFGFVEIVWIRKNGHERWILKFFFHYWINVT